MGFLDSVGNFVSGIGKDISSGISSVERGIGSAGKAIGNVAGDVGKYVEAHPWQTAAEAAAAAAAIALPFLAPEIGAGIAGLTGAEAAGAGIGAGEAAGIGAGEAAAAGAPLDILAGGEAAGTAGLETVGSIAPAAGAAGAELAPDLAGAGYGLNLAGDAVGLGAAAPSQALSFTSAGIPGADAYAGVPSIISEGTGGGGGAAFGPSAAFSGTPFDAGPAAASFGASGLGDAPSVAAASPGFLDSVAGAPSSALNWIKANPLMAASLGIGAGSIAKNIIAPTKLPNEAQLTGIAGQAGQRSGQLQGEGQTLLGPIQGGPLPAALEAQVTQGLNDAINTTKSRYAQLGLTGSTMESDQIAYLQQQAVVERGKLALNLAQEGNALISQSTADLGIESGIYQDLMNVQIAQDNALSTSIAQFAGAAANAAATMSRPVYNVQATRQA